MKPAKKPATKPFFPHSPDRTTLVPLTRVYGFSVQPGAPLLPPVNTGEEYCRHLVKERTYAARMRLHGTTVGRTSEVSAEQRQAIEAQARADTDLHMRQARRAFQQPRFNIYTFGTWEYGPDGEKLPTQAEFRARIARLGREANRKSSSGVPPRPTRAVPHAATAAAAKKGDPSRISSLAALLAAPRTEHDSSGSSTSDDSADNVTSTGSATEQSPASRTLSSNSSSASATPVGAVQPPSTAAEALQRHPATSAAKPTTAAAQPSTALGTARQHPNPNARRPQRACGEAAAAWAAGPSAP